MLRDLLWDVMCRGGVGPGGYESRSSYIIHSVPRLSQLLHVDIAHARTRSQ